MRKTFYEYYPLQEDRLVKIWDTGLFVLDSNVLINLYEFSKNTRDEFIEILQTISSRLWIPNQAALEYQSRRLDVIARQKHIFNQMRNDLKSKETEIVEKINKFPKYHPIIDRTELIKKVETKFDEIDQELIHSGNLHPDLIKEDNIRNIVDELFEGKVGKPCSEEALKSLYEKGKKRYERKIPPGYKDQDKNEQKKYNDLIIWFQLITEAKNEKKPIIFITSDSKDDWWWKFFEGEQKGEIIGPRVELIREFVDKTGYPIFILNPSEFMELSRKYLNQSISQTSIDEAREIKGGDIIAYDFEKIKFNESGLISYNGEYYKLLTEPPTVGDKAVVLYPASGTPFIIKPAPIKTEDNVMIIPTKDGVVKVGIQKVSKDENLDT